MAFTGHEPGALRRKSRILADLADSTDFGIFSASDVSDEKLGFNSVSTQPTMKFGGYTLSRTRI